MDLTERVIRFSKEKGADLVGIASTDQFKADISPLGITPEDRRPEVFVQNAKSVVVIGLKIVDSVLDRLTGKTDVYSQTLKSYLHFYNYDLLDYIAVQTARYLEDRDFEAYPTQSRVFEFDKFDTMHAISTRTYVVFPFKVAAVLAGLGIIGKCSLLITPQYGPRIRFVSVITDAELSAGKPIDAPIEKICESCRECIESCPVSALSFDEKNKSFSINIASCYRVMVLNGCGICMAACPLGKRPRKKLKALFKT